VSWRDLAHAFPVVDIVATPSGGTGITGTFRTGENVTQAVTGATGRLVYADTATDTLDLEVTTGTFSGDNDITGDTSGASWDAGTGASYPTATDFGFDLGDGSGVELYTGNVGANIAGTGAETINNVYQYSKYLARHEEETYIFNGPGTDVGTVGNLYRRLTDTFAEIKPGEPVGTFAGVSMFLAQGWALDATQLASADIRSFRVTNNAGTNRNPPNLQALTITGLVIGDRVAAFRATGAAGGGSTVILRNEFDVGTVGAGNNQAADSTILIGANTRTVSPTPADVPNTGILYVLDPNGTGNYLQFPYNAVDRTTNVFTLTSGTIGAVTGGQDLVLDDNVHVAFILETATATSASNTLQYVADFPVVYKGRIKGIKPFRGTGDFTSTGLSAGIQRLTDTIVDLP
jgi:hypothetical protein